MHTALTVRDETAFGPGGLFFSFTVEVEGDRVTAEELIRERVRQEVAEYNARRPEYFRGLVQPTDAERTLNGYKLKRPRALDWEEQYEKALAAFGRNGFILLVDDRQVESLDEVIRVEPDTAVTFLKLIPLVGG
jgi:hypothetical protein